MTDAVAKALETQLANIEKRSGKSLAELAEIVRSSGLSKHGEIRDMLKRELGMGHGDANTLTHHVLKAEAANTGGETEPSADDAVSALYSGAKAPLRPVHEKLMAEIKGFGEFEASPKKTYVSLRRRKQFATVGPATKTQVEVGLNAKGLAAAGRLTEMPPNSMCNYKVRLVSEDEVDAELIAWLKRAYDGAA